MKIPLWGKVSIALAIVAALLGAYFFFNARFEAHDRLVKTVEDIQGRLSVADSVTEVKYSKHQAIEDKAQEEKVIQAVVAQAKTEGVDPAKAQQVFETQIQASKDVQNSLFIEWSSTNKKIDNAPNIDALRTQISDYSTKILQDLKNTQEQLKAPSCKSDVSSAYDEVVTERSTMTAIQKNALKTAVGTLCD